MWHYTYRDLCQIDNFHFHIFYGYFGGESWAPHSHEFGELILVRRGVGTHICDEGRYFLETGDVFYIRPNEVHGYEELDNFAYGNIVFDPKVFLAPHPELLRLPGYQALFHVEPFLRSNHQFASKLHIDGDALQRAFTLFDEMVQEYESGVLGCEPVIRSILTVLITHLARQYTDQESPKSQTVINISKVICYIEANYRESISLGDILDIACMSKSSLMRAFQQWCGMSPIRYLNIFRLKRARQMLAASNVPIGNIAMTVGFSDTNYFSRLFHNVYHMSPREYRSEAKSKRSE